MPGFSDFFLFAVRRRSVLTVILSAAILNPAFSSPCGAMQAVSGPGTVQNNSSPGTGQIPSSPSSPPSPAPLPSVRGPASSPSPVRGPASPASVPSPASSPSVPNSASQPSVPSPTSASSARSPASGPSVQSWVQSILIDRIEGGAIYSKDGRQFETGGAKVIDNSRRITGAKQADLFYQNGELMEVILR